ncbi:MAG: hypothetical protein KVP17_000996 [Porospora cf. gigantea B]|uniref:uncharacterized protein n=1 Tax=Porospora cf. gigantea B TaxID=2853592 RepID=UPI003571DBA8|nr:MAG: hypothetical protein KVP17_000996 [Porospora cf. gigantea B]
MAVESTYSLVGDYIVYAQDYTTDYSSIMGDEATSIYFKTRAGFVYQDDFESPFDNYPMACARECHAYKYSISSFQFTGDPCWGNTDDNRRCWIMCTCALNHDAEDHYENLWKTIEGRNFWKTFYPTQFQQYFFSARPVASSLQSTDIQCRHWCMNVVTPQCKYWTFHLVGGVCSALVDTGKIIFNEDYMSGYGALPEGMPPWPANYVPHSVRGDDPVQDWTTLPRVESDEILTTIAYPGLLQSDAIIFYTLSTLLIVLSIVAPIIVILVLWLTKNMKEKRARVKVRGRVIRHELTPGGNLDTMVLEESDIYDSSEAVLM